MNTTNKIKVKNFKLICEGGQFSTTRHTNIEEVKSLYLNQIFRDLDFSLKKCIAVELEHTEE